MAGDKIYYRKMIDLKAEKDRGGLILQPDFQRNFIWDLEKQSRLVESLILGYPINPLHFAESSNRKIEVIDGQQRLSSCFRYIENIFPLKKLKQLPTMNGKYFKELPDQMQYSILNYSIGVFPYNGDDQTKYEVFERLNQASTVLNHQELRNCVFNGTYNSLIKTLSKLAITKQVLNLDSKRMKDCELILTFFAAQNYDFLYITSSNAVRDTLTKELRENRNLRDYEIKGKEEQWVDFLECAAMIYENPFRRKTNLLYLFNESIFIAASTVIPKYSKKVIAENAATLKQELEKLYVSEDFLYSISADRSSTSRARDAIVMHEKLFEDVLGAQTENKLA